MVRHSFLACGISSALDGSDDHLLNDRMADALNAADREANIRDEAADLLFDSDGDDTDEDFQGFSASEDASDDDE